MPLSFRTEALVNAPPVAVWRVLVDVAAWPTWNSTVTKVEGQVALGAQVTVHVKINPGRAFPVKVTQLDAPHTMVWTGGMPAGAFQGQRTYTLTPGPTAGTTQFVMEEVYTGWMAWLITRTIPNLQPDFDTFAACLQARAAS